MKTRELFQLQLLYELVIILILLIMISLIDEWLDNNKTNITWYAHFYSTNSKSGTFIT